MNITYPLQMEQCGLLASLPALQHQMGEFAHLLFYVFVIVPVFLSNYWVSIAVSCVESMFSLSLLFQLAAHPHVPLSDTVSGLRALITFLDQGLIFSPPAQPFK